MSGKQQQPWFYGSRVPGKFDPKFKMAGFETFDDVQKRRRQLIRDLCRGDRAQRKLAQTLETCRKHLSGDTQNCTRERH